MKSQDYRAAIFRYFNVTSSKELRTNPQWQEIAEREGLTNLQTLKSLKRTYQVIFGCTQDSSDIGDSVESAFGKETSNHESVDSIEDNLITSKLNSDTEETGCFHVMEDNQGNTVGALLEYSSEQSQKLIQHFKNLELHSPQPWHQGRLSSAVVDQLGITSTLVATGLQTGQLFRAVGPPDLVAKVASGAYQMMQTSTGALGTVTSGAGKIAGQLRFASGGSALPVLAPIAVYQLLHAIVGTQQLNQINQRLAKIEHTLQELYVRHEAAVLGEIHSAINILDDVLASRMNTGIFSPDATTRLAIVEHSILSILERNRILVDRFRNQASTVTGLSGRQGARSAAELLKTDGPQAVFDMQCLVGLIAADLKIEQARLLLTMQDNPADIGRRQDRIRCKMQNHQETVESFPSVQEIERHARSCLEAMCWWQRLFDFNKTKKEVKAAQNLNLKDVRPSAEALQLSLNGYVFWKDAEGVHAFLVSGEDLRLTATEKHDESPLPNQNALRLTVQTKLSPGRNYKIRLPDLTEPINVFVEKEVEPGLWLGYRNDEVKLAKVHIRHKDFEAPKLQEDI